MEKKAQKKALVEALRKVIKRMHCPLEVMLTCMRWYAAYPLGLRHIAEMMSESGLVVDHATVHTGQSRSFRCSVRYFVGVSGPWARVGVWMRPTSR